MNEVSKSDWKLYRSKIAQWQEDYMDRLVKEYIAMLQADEDASDKFWNLEKRINEDKRTPGVRIELSKRNMLFDLVHLINDGVISFADLADFSQELQNDIKMFMERFCN